MSRQISHRYLLFYLSASVILACGLSRRIPREASCPSCSLNLDCPEVLTGQLPWNPRESNLRDFSTNQLQNSPYSRLISKKISQDIAHDNTIPLNQNSMSFENYRRFLQQEPTSKNFFSKNYLNNSPKFLDRREIFSQDKPAREYPLVPSKQIFDRSEKFFRNSRNKHSESLIEDYKRTKDYKKIEEDPTSKVLATHRADRDTKPVWKNSRDTTNVIQSERFFPKVENIYRQEDILDEERNAIKKSSNSASQLLRYPQERYNSIGFDSSQVKHTPAKNRIVPISMKEFFDNWDRDRNSSQSSNLGQFKNNLLEVHSARKPEIIAKNNNEQVNSYNSKFPQDLNIWESKKDKESIDSLMRTNTRHFENEDDEDMEEYFEDETGHFMNEKDMEEYFDEAEQDTIKTERNNYNSRVLPQNTWKDVKNEELLDDLDFMREKSRETESGLYSKKNKYFQDEQNEDIIFQDKAYTSAETDHAPVVNTYNAYELPRYLNIVNNKKHPAKFEMQELSEAKNSKNSNHANPIKEMDQRFFKNEGFIEDNTRSQDLILPKDIFDVKEYSNPIADKRNNVRNKNEAPTKLDPDLLDDIEDPPIETTKSTLM